MRLFGPGSISTPARVILEVLLVLICLYLVLEGALFATLLVDPLHPMRKYFQVTAFAAVPPGVWQPDYYMRATTTIAGQPAGFPLGLWLAIDFPLGTIASGLAVVVLAEILKAGADLQDDQALTV